MSDFETKIITLSTGDFLIRMKRSATYFIRQRKHTGMPDADCPPFKEIVFCLFIIIFSLFVIGYIQLGAGVRYWGEVPLHAIVVSIIFILVMGYSVARLILLLFPGRKKSCPMCSLLAKVLEIDHVAGLKKR